MMTRDHWAVVVLTDGPAAALREKLLPYALFLRLKSSRDVYYTSQEDIEEQDLWYQEVPGWHVTPRGAEVIRAEAEKEVALNPGLKTEVERRRAEKEERARREVRVKELISELVRLERELDVIRRTEGAPVDDPRDPEGERVDDPRDPNRWWVIDSTHGRIVVFREVMDTRARFQIPLTPGRIAALRRIAGIAAELKALGYGNPDVVDAYAREVA